jgi:hypothetical protein
MLDRHTKTSGIALHRPGTGKENKRNGIKVHIDSLKHTFVPLCQKSNAPLAVDENTVGKRNPARRYITNTGRAVAELGRHEVI